MKPNTDFGLAPFSIAFNHITGDLRPSTLPAVVGAGANSQFREHDGSGPIHAF